MTDLTTPMYDDMDDVELIVTYLQDRLPADRAEAVKRRLTEDAEFREFAAPLLLVWSVPPRWKRKPRPEGETERAWAEFVKRTGFPERRPEPPVAPPEPPAPAPRRSRIGRFFEISFWSVAIYVVVLSLGAVLWYDVIKPNWFPDPTDGYVAPSGVVAPPTSPR